MLAYSLAMVNGLALVDGCGNLIKEVNEMVMKPDSFTTIYKQIIDASSGDDILMLCRKLIQGVRDLLTEMKKNIVQSKEEKEYISYEDLAFWYQEARYTFRKIAYYAEIGDAPQCYSLGCYLQIEFDAIQDEFGLEELDLLGMFDAKDLKEFAQKSNKLENYIVDVIEKQNVTINRYESLEDFLIKHSM